jgi:hypothetical protein
MLIMTQEPRRKPITVKRQVARVARLETKLATLQSQLEQERALLDQLTSESDPIVGYQCAHYLTHQTFENEKWIGLYLTPDKWLAQSAACEDSGKLGFPATSSDLICKSVHKSELEQVITKHTRVRKFEG